MITEQNLINYLQSQLDDFNEDKARYGISNHMVSKKFDAMIACKEMAETLIGKPVNLGRDGKVTVTEGLINILDRKNEDSDNKNPYADIIILTGDHLIKIAEGSGDNLDNEDRQNGFIDYIYYEAYDLYGENQDGGMVMLKEYFVDSYKSTRDCIKDVLDDLYDDDKKVQEIIDNGIKIFDCSEIDELPTGVVKEAV